MAVVVYQCDTCKRETYRQQNRKGLDVISRCIITNGCRGKLNLQEVKPSYAIGHATPAVIGLADWTARKVLFTFNQGFLKKTWEVNHNLNNQPSLSVYVYRDPNDLTSLTKVEPETVTYISNDTIRLTFKNAVTGIVQCQARSASDGQNVTSLLPKEIDSTDATVFSTSKSFGLSNGLEPGELTIATRVSTLAVTGFAPTRPIELHLHFLSPVDLSEIGAPIVLTMRDLNNTPVDTNASPWAGATYATIHGRKYLLRSVNIHTLGNLTLLGIPQGAPCYVTIKYDVTHNPDDPTSPPYNPVDRELAENEMLALTSVSPHHSVDRNFSEVVDMSRLTKEAATAYTSYVDQDILGNTALLEEIFPSIILV